MADEKPTITMSTSIEKPEVETTQNLESLHVVKKVHADGHVDLVDAHAIGGAVEDMPPGYFWSISFIGTVTVCITRLSVLRQSPRSTASTRAAHFPIPLLVRSFLGMDVY